MQISLKQIQTQETTSDFSLTDIERENLSLFQIKDLPLSSRTINALTKAHINNLADLISTPDQTIKGIRNIGSKSFDEISKIKEKQLDELYKARGFQRSFPRDKETLTLLSELKKDFSYFSEKTEESIWYDICRKNLATPVSNPFLSYEDLLSELFVISENLLLLILWFKNLTKDKNIIKITDFNKLISKIPHASLMINALEHTIYIMEKDGYYIEKSHTLFL